MGTAPSLISIMEDGRKLGKSFTVGSGKAPATGKEDGFHDLLNSNPTSFETVKSSADKRKLNYYVSLMVI